MWVDAENIEAAMAAQARNAALFHSLGPSNAFEACPIGASVGGYATTG